MANYEPGTFKLAVQLAAPSLANRELLASAANESVAAQFIVNAYKAVLAAEQRIMNGN
jgi:hypothetical protein